ncbi:MAG: energy transducer TonB [Myxococcales bacterium]|nr:energy transducer TonB [Myxococcales bacterium]MDH5305849.1 energy transducer TonB [Myxococcales bacterium]MDH5566824.1 energy transducer TonB [Myxococcales bacterium]
MGPRHFIAFLAALFVTFGLFWVMQALIGVKFELDESMRGRVIDFVRLKRESEIEEKERKLPDKKPPEEPPPPPDLNLAQNLRPDSDMGEVIPLFDSGIELSGGPTVGGAATDSDVVPLVRVQPQYPERARQRGLEGWVEVEFTISTAGTVKNPRVTNYYPSTIFNRAALRAIRKWKYNPKIEDGQPVERPGVKVRLTFEMDQS